MERWRAADEQPVTTGQAVATALVAVAEEVVELGHRTGTRPWVLACWQDRAYVGTPDGLPLRLAASADVVVACVGRHATWPTVEHVQLEADEPLAAEWSLTAVTPAAGLTFVARELGGTLPATTVEGGRTFRHEASADPAEVAATAHRLLRDLGARARPATVAGLRSTVTALTDVAVAARHRGRPDDGGFAARIAELVGRADDARRDRTPAPDAGGLAGLAGWLTDAGPRAPRLGMVVLRADAGGLAARLRDRVDVPGVGGGLVVDVPPDAAMLVVPGLVGPALSARAAELRDTLAAVMGCAVTGLGVEVPAVEARRDLVGSLGRALATLRGAAVA